MGAPIDRNPTSGSQLNPQLEIHDGGKTEKGTARFVNINVDGRELKVTHYFRGKVPDDAQVREIMQQAAAKAEGLARAYGLGTAEGKYQKISWTGDGQSLSLHRKEGRVKQINPNKLIQMAKKLGTTTDPQKLERRERKINAIIGTDQTFKSSPPGQSAKQSSEATTAARKNGIGTGSAKRKRPPVPERAPPEPPAKKAKLEPPPSLGTPPPSERMTRPRQTSLGSPTLKSDAPQINSDEQSISQRDDMDIGGSLRLNPRYDKICDEVATTEETYLNNLEKLSKALNEAIDQDGADLQEIATLRKGLSQAIEVSKALNQELTAIKNDSSLSEYEKGEKMAKAIINAYQNNPLGDYASNFDEKIEALDRYPQLQNAAINPIQRMPRYELLIKELHKQTPETSPQKAKLKEHLSSIEDINQKFNEATNVSEITSQELSDAAKILRDLA